MILHARYLRPLGYKGSGMFDDSASYSHQLVEETTWLKKKKSKF